MNTPTAAQHTPGPWQPAGCTVYQADTWRDGNNLGGRQIARAYPCPIEFPDVLPTEEDLANARLIAAAPDLLEACKMAEMHYLPTPVLIALRNAIIKATGELK
jgi:hypothetical protein